MNLCDIPASYADAASNAREAGYEKVRLVPRKAGVRCPLPQLVEWPLVGTFVFVRLIVKLSTNWNDTTSTHVAGEPCSTEALTDLIYEGLAEPRLFGLGRGSRFGENWSVYFSESVTSGKLNCAQSPAQSEQWCCWFGRRRIIFGSEEIATIRADAARRPTSVTAPTCFLRTSELFASWKQWCDERNLRPGSMNTLSDALYERGFERARDSRGNRGFRGLTIKTSTQSYD
jgi:hypothetical protein